MPEISVTDDQRERLRRVQAHLGEDVAYGHVRPRDALEYLLDRFAEEVESGADSTETTADADGAPSGGFEVRNGRAATASVEESVDDGDDESDEGAAEARVLDASERTDAADTTETTSGDDDDHVGVSNTTTGSGGADGSEETDGSVETDDSGDANDDARLNSVMSLLDDHDEVWREAGGGEEKYEVDLPDGGTERARTKDDVRAVLFKHYR